MAKRNRATPALRPAITDARVEELQAQIEDLESLTGLLDRINANRAAVIQRHKQTLRDIQAERKRHDDMLTAAQDDARRAGPRLIELRAELESLAAGVA